MGGQVVVVKDPDAKHSGVNAGTQKEDGDEARHLVRKRDINHLLVTAEGLRESDIKLDSNN